MGNYGNTIDRWYHRSAVVLWPANQAFSNRAEANPAWALDAIQRSIDTGDLAQARADAVSLQRFWRQVDPASIGSALCVAGGLADPTAASVVLAPYQLETVTGEDAEPLAAAVTAYGDAWWTALLDQWDKAGYYGGQGRDDWCGTTLPQVCRALIDHGSPTAADILAGRMWQQVWRQARAALNSQHPGHRAAGLTKLGPALASLVQCSPPELGETIVAQLRDADDTITPLLVAVLRASRLRATSTVSAISQDCWERLVRQLAQPERADDWSISWSGCGCADCQRFAGFLGSPTERTLDWPLAQRRRQHIHQLIDRAGLPVTHVTRRKGSPYVLVLTETDELFAREASDRHEAEAALMWVVSAFG
ncbi:hypothetical protein EFY87_04550 [Flexivirga caeni]|uniref:Uncharacterized protein n=2 Tax=Flexivirga caeni TaxID=2294115 RepID=A0A3M9MGC5_9MICO|nr:hypothetical protein EFY87_04550 [Flexivirga caeni]